MQKTWRELSNAYLLAKFGFDTAENEPCKVCPEVRIRGSWGQVGGGKSTGRVDAEAAFINAACEHSSTVDFSVQGELSGAITEAFVSVESSATSEEEKLSAGSEEAPVQPDRVQTWAICTGRAGKLYKARSRLY